MPPIWRPGLDEDKRRAILDSGRLIPVSPRGGLYLVSVAHFPVEQTAIAILCDSSAPETHKRFAGVFRETWRRLPRRARMRLRRYWRQESWRRHDLPFCPRISLLPDWPERPWSWAEVCMAQWWGAHEIRFWLPAINLMPDDIAATVVAGALGRILYYIHRMIDERWHGLPRPRDHREWLRMTPQERHEQEPCGATVRRWLRRWGLDRAAVSNWVSREKDLRYLDARYPQLFRYPPALDIPVDLTRYKNMQPRPLLRGSRFASYADWAT